MRIINIKNRDIEVRSLTGGEVKKLKQYGFGTAVFIPAMGSINDAWDSSFDLVLSPGDLVYLDSLPNGEKRPVWDAILAETYGSVEEEKNLNGTSDGTQIIDVSNTVKSVVPEQQS